MVNLCPNEADPSENVEEFVRDPAVSIMPGLRGYGLVPMMEAVEAEIRRQEPDSTVIVLDRDVLADNSITFPSELEAYIRSRVVEGRRTNVLVNEDLPVLGWQGCVEFLRGTDAQVYCAGFSCKFVPVCTKYFEFL